MKKWVLALVAAIVIMIAAIYIFIPSNLAIADAVNVKCTAPAANRLLQQDESWRKWWPGNTTNNANEAVKYHYQEFTFSPDKKLYNKRTLLAKKSNLKVDGSVNILSYSIDSMQLLWMANLQTSMNPFTRIFQYSEAKQLKKNMDEILNRMKTFLEDDQNIYGFRIAHTTLKDTALVAIKTATRDTPSTVLIYEMKEKLQQYITVEGALSTSFPMLNITKLDSNHFVTMVAIGTNKELKDKGNFFLRRMIAYKDKILTTEVKGGAANIKKAYEAINIYMNDHQISSPVIHFEYLVTDRLKETDSTKWITRIYMPIV